MSITQILRVMKLTAILLTVCCVHLMAAAGAQTISYNAKNVSLNEIFKVVKKQTGYFVVYNATQINTKQTVTINAKDQPLTQFLSAVLTNMNLEYTIENKTIVISQKSKKLIAPISPDLSQGSQASTIDIRGKVTDESGKPVVGASVQVKGTNKGTTTNNEGEFVLTGVDEKATLVISAVNIETREVAVSGRKEINLVAKAKVSKLEDVEITNINTGYQSIPKERATGSFTQVDNKTLNLQVGSNILNRLEAVTSSLAFNKSIGLGGTKPPLTIRGLSTMNGPTAPLIVVDNFPFEGDINTINPNMVESITILKDATAASIWGTRAGNGVIVINTKKGKYNKPLSVEFNSNVQLTNKPNIYYQNPISSSEYIDLEQFLYGKGFYTSQINSSSRPVLSPIVEIMDLQSRGIISSSDASTQIANLRKINLREQYDKYVYSNAINNQYSLNFSGGSQQLAWSASGGYDKNTSSLDEKYERITARLENNFKMAKNLTISGSIYFTKTNSQSGKNEFPNNLISYPYTQFFDENGKSLPVALAYRKSFLDTLGGGKLLDWNYYPGEDYKHKTSTTILNSILANFGFQYQIGNGFSFEFKYQYELQQSQTNNLSDLQSYNTRHLINSFSQLNRQTGVVSYIVPKGGIFDILTNKMVANNFRGQINYNQIWGKHQIVSLIGSDIREVVNESMNNRTYGFDPENILGIPVDLKNSYPNLALGFNSFIPNANDFGKSLARTVSFFGNGAYTFNKKYSLTISARRDASNLFGVETNNKWKPLWSVGAGWDISKESFYNWSVLPSLKVRATYGYTGNSNPKSVGVATTLSIGTANLSGLPYSIIQNFPNPQLRWEQVGITNFGVDFAFKRNVVSGSFEWYYKKGTDLIAFSPLDITAGAGSGQNKNVSDIITKGIDLIVNANIIDSKFHWNSGLIFNYNIDRAANVFSRFSLASDNYNSGFSVLPIEGKSIYSLRSYKYAGLDKTGDPLGYLNGIISKDYAGIGRQSFESLEYSGSALPQFFGSLSNIFSFKGFELGINVSYKFGYYFRRQGVSYVDLYNASNGRILTSVRQEDYINRWQQAGDELRTDVLSMIYPANSSRESFYNNSSLLVEKGDHIRLQFINCSYQFNIRKTGVNNNCRLQLYCNASNLGILWRANTRGIDPDYLVTSIPPSASYAFGVRCFF